MAIIDLTICKLNKDGGVKEIYLIEETALKPFGFDDNVDINKLIIKRKYGNRNRKVMKFTFK